MSPARRLASKLLHAVVRHSSSDTLDWANAMLRELDFIENNCSALFWALGSTTAIFRHSVPRRLRSWVGKHSSQEEGPMLRHIRKNAAGTISGVAIAGGVLVCAFGLVRLSFLLFPASDVEWTAPLGMIAAPGTIFVIAAVALWRKRRSMAVGMVVSAVALVAHVVVHLTTH
jgi:hypothetical protein